jgi:integrase
LKSPLEVAEGHTVQDLENRASRIVSRIGERNAELGKLVERWHASLKATLPNPKSRLVKLNRVHRWLRWAEYPSLDTAVERIESFFGFLDDVSLEERQGVQSVLRAFVKWAGRPVPDVLTRRVYGARRPLMRDDLLTNAEIQGLINVCDHPRDRAFLATLWDTGARIDEVCQLRYGDVRAHPDYPAALVVVLRKSKTVARQNTLFEAAPYLRDWLNVHPAKKPTSPLWAVMKGKGSNGGGLDTDSARWRFYHMAERAKRSGLIPLHKRVHPHLMRHTRATRLVELGYNETKLKQRLGWGLDSKMLPRYITLAEEGDSDEEARIHGVKVVENRPKSGLDHTLCARCEAPNSPTNRFCSVCGAIMKESDREILLKPVRTLAELRERAALAEEQVRAETDALSPERLGELAERDALMDYIERLEGELTKRKVVVER